MTGTGGGGQGPTLEAAPVDEVLESDVVTVQRDTPVTEIVGKMADEDVGSVIIVEEENPVGILTDRTIALSLEESQDVGEKTAEDFDIPDLVTGSTDMTVFEVLRQMEDQGIRRMPIVDDEGNLEGIVTLDDIIVVLNAELSNTASIIESQSRRF